MEIKLELLPTEERDRVLGAYMDAFSNLEGSVDRLIQALLGTDWEAARALSSVLYSQQRIKLVEALAAVRVPDKIAKKIANQCVRLSKRNMRRNHIVHGSWLEYVTIDDDHYTQEWIRTYTPSDPSLAAIHDLTDSRLLGTYSFTIAALTKATIHVQEMHDALSPLFQAIIELIPQPPVHEAGALKNELES